MHGLRAAVSRSRWNSQFGGEIQRMKQQTENMLGTTSMQTNKVPCAIKYLMAH